MFAIDPVFRQAACAGLPPEERELFFALGNSHTKAKKYCLACPITEECLQRVLEFEEPGERFGVWGGLSARERNRRFGGEEVA